MSIVKLKQSTGNHLYEVYWDDTLICYCDQLAAEELALGVQEEGHTVKWLYQEDVEDA